MREYQLPIDRKNAAPLLQLLLAAALLAGCGGHAPDESHPSAEPGTSQNTGASSARGAEVQVDPADQMVQGSPEEGAAPAQDQHDTPAVIYYDLTTFDWYRHGKPLLVEGRSYLPGRVAPTGERRLERGGAYDGVDFYILKGQPAPHDTLFIPVYRGYWLSFVLAAPPNTGN
jgi:hypothetical protein